MGVPLGEAAGGQGVPEGVVPGVTELPAWLFPVVGDEPGFDVSGFVDPELGEPEFVEPEFVEPELVEPEVADPEFDSVLLGDPAVPGKLPQGEPPGVVPGVFCVLGFTVEGCVLLPGVGFSGEFDPGILPAVEPGVAFPGVGFVPFGKLDLTGACGAVCGVAVPAGGVTALGADLCPELCPEPCPELCPAEPLLPAAEPPELVLCATTHAAQSRTINSNVNFRKEVIFGIGVESTSFYLQSDTFGAPPAIQTIPYTTYEQPGTVCFRAGAREARLLSRNHGVPLSPMGYWNLGVSDKP